MGLLFTGKLPFYPNPSLSQLISPWWKLPASLGRVTPMPGLSAVIHSLIQQTFQAPAVCWSPCLAPEIHKCQTQPVCQALLGEGGSCPLIPGSFHTDPLFRDPWCLPFFFLSPHLPAGAVAQKIYPFICIIVFFFLSSTSSTSNPTFQEAFGLD
jgi:hypothetical protein